MIKRSINLFLGNKCNYNCKYCTQNRKTEKEFDIQKFLEFTINNEKNINTDVLYISGGEPMLYLDKNMVEILLRYYGELKITTNFSKNIDDILVRGRIKFITSYHSLGRDKFDYSFVRKLLKYKDYVAGISFVLEKDNYYHFQYLMDFAKEKGFKVKVIPEMSYTNNSKCISEYAEMKELLKYYYSHEGYRNSIENFNTGNISNECHLHKVTYGWDNKLYPCRVISDMYFEDFNGKYSIGDWTSDLSSINDKYAEFNPIKSYDGTLCSECGKCGNNICNYYSGVNDGTISENMCEFYRIIDEVKNDNSEYYRLNPTTIMAILTKECNMRCKYCYQENKPISSEHMSIETMKNTIDLLNNSFTKDKRLVLFGGEPTMNRKAVEYAINYFIKNNIQDIRLEIDTNILHIDEHLIGLYKKAANNIKFALGVSLDGNKELNDFSRVDIFGKGTFDRIYNNIIKVRKEIPNLFISVHTVVSKNIINNGLYETLKFLLEHEEKGIFNNLSVGLVTRDTTEEPLTEKECEMLVNTYYKLIDEGIDKEKVNNIMSFSNPEIVTSENDDEGCGSCYAGHDSLAVMPNGDTTVCHRYVEYDTKFPAIGNVNKLINNVVYVNKNSEYFNTYITRSYLKNVKNFEGYNCNTCLINKLCHICIGGNQIVNNDISINSENKCLTGIRIAEACAKIKIARELNNISKKLEVIEEFGKLSIKGQVGIAEFLVNKLENINIEEEK